MKRGKVLISIQNQFPTHGITPIHSVMELNDIYLLILVSCNDHSICKRLIFSIVEDIEIIDNQ